MIDQKEGETEMNVKIQYDNMVKIIQLYKLMRGILMN